MERFINSKLVEENKIDEAKVDKVIKLLNERINKSLAEKRSQTQFSVNDVLDGFSKLNSHEWNLASIFASREGWRLSSVNDNNNSITYKLTLKSDEF